MDLGRSAPMVNTEAWNAKGALVGEVPTVFMRPDVNWPDQVIVSSIRRGYSLLHLR